MQALPDLAAAIGSALSTRRFGRPLYVFDRVPSTNDVALRLAADGAAEGAAVLALEQTAGRGRLGRPWTSPPGGMYLSVILRPQLPADRWPLVGIAMAVAAASGIERVARGPITVKWPNDLLSDAGKVGGILVEAAGPSAVAGIGVNAAVPARQLPAGAASLDAELVPLVREVLCEVERFAALVTAHPAAVLERWRARSATLGRAVHVVGSEEVAGVAEDIDADGALLLRTSQGLRRVLAGDVSLR